MSELSRRSFFGAVAAGTFTFKLKAAVPPAPSKFDKGGPLEGLSVFGGPVKVRVTLRDASEHDHVEEQELKSFPFAGYEIEFIMKRSMTIVSGRVDFFDLEGRPIMWVALDIPKEQPIVVTPDTNLNIRGRVSFE